MASSASFSIKPQPRVEWERKPNPLSIDQDKTCSKDLARLFVDSFKARPYSLEFSQYERSFYFKVIKGVFDLMEDRSDQDDLGLDYFAIRKSVTESLDLLCKRGDLKFEGASYLVTIVSNTNKLPFRLSDLEVDIRKLFEDFTKRSAISALKKKEIKDFVFKVGEKLIALDTLVDFMVYKDEDNKPLEEKKRALHYYVNDQFVSFMHLKELNFTFMQQDKELSTPEHSKVKEIFPQIFPERTEDGLDTPPYPTTPKSVLIEAPPSSRAPSLQPWNAASKGRNFGFFYDSPRTSLNEGT